MSKIFSYSIALIVITIVILPFSFLVFYKNLTLNIPTRQPEETTSTTEQANIDKSPLVQYIEIMDSCGPSYSGSCVNVRSGPSQKYEAINKLRTGIVLKVAEVVTYNGRKWYKIQFDENVQFPERITSDWFVADGDYIRPFMDEGNKLLQPKIRYSGNKHILINISTQTLYAYDGDNLFMESSISTGLEFTPTPTGTFLVFKKTPSRYMQGSETGDANQYYDLPGVPWDLYFTYDGDVIHGTYWHDHFGQRWSHGCINVKPQEAMKLYYWTDIGTPVIVKN